MSDELNAQQPNDLRAELEAAIAKVETEQAEPAAQQAATEPEPTGASPTPSSDADASQHSQSAPPAAPPSSEGSVEGTEQQQAEPAKEAPKRKEKGPSAPIDWSPELRQQFPSLPEPIQQAIHQREVQVNNVLKETTEARRLAEQFVRTVEPYHTLMQAEGAQNPLQAIGALLQTAATLHLATPAQKAQRIAQMVKHYGIDIELLDKSLAGTMPESPAEDRLERLVNERMAPVNQLLQQVGYAQQQQQWQVQQQAVDSVAQLEGNPEYEFFEAVRPVMANFLDLAAQTGQPMTLDDAYQQACASVPAIRQQMLAKQMNGMAGSQQQNIQNKQNAASSIVGTRGTGPAASGLDPDKLSLRQMIEAQMSGGGQRI